MNTVIFQNWISHIYLFYIFIWLRLWEHVKSSYKTYNIEILSKFIRHLEHGRVIIFKLKILFLCPYFWILTCQNTRFKTMKTSIISLLTKKWNEAAWQILFGLTGLKTPTKPIWSKNIILLLLFKFEFNWKMKQLHVKLSE